MTKIFILVPLAVLLFFLDKRKSKKENLELIKKIDRALDGQRYYALNIDKSDHIKDHLFVDCYYAIDDKVDLKSQTKFSHRQRKYLLACYDVIYTDGNPPKSALAWFKKHKMMPFCDNILAKSKALKVEMSKRKTVQTILQKDISKIAELWVQEFDLRIGSA